MKHWIIAIFATSSALAGCDAKDIPEETVGCTSTRQCNLYEVCNVLSGFCVPEPQEAVLGSFYCSNLYPTGGTGEGTGIGSFSEVAGNVNLIDTKGGRTMTRVNTATPPLCQFEDGMLHIGLFDSKLKVEGQGVYVRVSAPVSRLVPGQLADITDPSTYQAFAARGELRTITEHFMQAGDTRVQVYVEAVPVVGQPVRGYLDIAFEDMEEPPPAE